MASYKKESFYKASSDWSYDIYQSQRVWLRRALLSIFVLCVFLAASLSSTLILIPLKEKVPYLYAFDHATGEVTKIGTLERTTLSDDWQLTRTFLEHYVINYESYDSDNLEVPYQQVWAQSSPHVQEEYNDEVNSDNTNSPYKLFGKDKYVTAHVLSINKLNDSTVDIRFQQTIHDRLTSMTNVIEKEAIIKWNYDDAETSQKMLDRDPLGFKVNYYKATKINSNTAKEI